MILKALRHYCLVSEMIGVEGIVTAELAFMIVNLQSLGMSVALTSIPLIASALTSLVLIPLLGFITVRCAKTTKQKALSLIAVNAWQILGVVLIIFANIMRLQEDQILNKQSTNITISTLGIYTIHTALDLTNLHSTSANSNSTNTVTTISTGSDYITKSPISNSLYYGVQNVSTSSQSSEDITENGHVSTEVETGLKAYAILAIIGYIMSDSGYDTGSCFLKTFALSSTPQKDHPEVIVRASQVSSFGGIFVTLLGSVGVGERLAKGTELDVNSVTTIFIMALMAVILLPTSVVTLTTGLCCTAGLNVQDSDDSKEDEEVEERLQYDVIYDEKQKLLSASTSSAGNNDKVNERQTSFSSTRNTNDVGNHTSDTTARLRSTSTTSQGRQNSVSKDLMNMIFQLSHSGAHSLMEEELNTVNANDTREERGRDFAELIGNKGCFKTLQNFFRQQEKRLILCTGNFFALGALFAFNVYSVNFVTVSICDGDPNSPIGSEKYKNYLRGIKIGSTGLLVFYASFVVGTTVQDILLRKVGWWMESSIMFTIYIVGNTIVAITKLEWIYYICAFTSGLYRSVIFTVPYILACRLLTENKDDPDLPGKRKTKVETSGDIALVAAMLPLSMVMCAVVIGPMMQLTGNAATPIYFSGVSAAIGFGLFSLLRKY